MTPAEFDKVFRLPFDEATRFFRDKLTVPTGAWDELSGAAHAKGFTSAGAYQADLLSDLRAMTDKAIAGGMDIREFRKEFKGLVSRSGWQLKGGGPAWRSDLIWRTNITTAYQAGRWEQFRESGITHLKYVHSDGVMHPRPNHQAMDGTVLPIDDPFWSANYPPNGWGCKCRAVAVPPAVSGTPRPAGWQGLADEGWRYNVGQAGEQEGYRALTEKLDTLPNDIARGWMKRFVNEPAFDRFIGGKITGEFPCAVLWPVDMDRLGCKTQTVWFSDDSLSKNKGELPARSAGHTDLTVDDYRMIPEIVDNGEVYVRSEERLIMLKMGDVTYRAVIKRTRDKGRNYMLSLFKSSTDSRAVKQLKDKGYERIR